MSQKQRNRQVAQRRRRGSAFFVLHNKDKEKKGHLPAGMVEQGRYLAARTVGDVWITYLWEAMDIKTHDRMAQEQTIE